MFLGNNGLFSGIHAADSRTVPLIAGVVPGTHTLNPGNLLGIHVVGGTLNVPMVGAGCRKNSLELQTGYHIGVTVVTILLPKGRISEVKSGGKDYRAHIQFLYFIFLVILYGIDTAKVFTCLTSIIEKVHAGLPVDNRCLRYCLGER
jgi:hypothetical protein